MFLVHCLRISYSERWGIRFICHSTAWSNFLTFTGMWVALFERDGIVLTVLYSHVYQYIRYHIYIIDYGSNLHTIVICLQFFNQHFAKCSFLENYGI